MTAVGCLQVAFFRDISKTASQQRQLYAASAAVGIGAYMFSTEGSGLTGLT
jgi:hypothetical protein